MVLANADPKTHVRGVLVAPWLLNDVWDLTVVVPLGDRRHVLGCRHSRLPDGCEPTVSWSVTSGTRQHAWVARVLYRRGTPSYLGCHTSLAPSPPILVFVRVLPTRRFRRHVSLPFVTPRPGRLRVGPESRSGAGVE